MWLSEISHWVLQKNFPGTLRLRMYFQKSSLLKMVPPANEHVEAGHFVSEVGKVTRLHLLHTSGTNLMRKIVERPNGLGIS